MNIIFTPTERDTFQRCMDITNGLGYDLVLDFTGSMKDMKRQVLKLSSFYGIIATSYQDMQLDPPESKFLNQKCATITFINYKTMLESGLHDGVAKTLMTDLHSSLLKNEFGHVMSQYVNTGNGGQSNYGMGGGSSAPQNSGSNKIKRYNLLDLFDD